jgi:hypothetical protein
MKKLVVLAGCTLIIWALAIYPAWLLDGDSVWIHSLTALCLCLLPALATLAWALSSGDTAEPQLTTILGGSGIRLAFALGGGLLLYRTFPETFTDAFWIWMGLFYMFILALETLLILRKRQNGLA